MKKIFFSAFLIAAVHLAQAQSIPAGTISLGGNIGYNRGSSENSGITSGNNYQSVDYSVEATGWQLYLQPAISYFVANNLAVGLSLGYAHSRQVEDARYAPAITSSQHVQSKAVWLRTGAFAQYYKMLTAQFGLTGRLGSGYQRSEQDRNGHSITNGATRYFSGATTDQGYYADLTPGLIFFPVPQLGLTASMGSVVFSHLSLTDSYYNDTNGTSYSQAAKSNRNELAANFILSAFQLGGTYYFGR